MNSFLAGISFGAPLVLWSLLLLPALWWLLRLMPPRAKKQVFPALRLLHGLSTAEQTPAHTPWWMLVLRGLLAACIILAAADPVRDPARALPGTGPLILVVDNSWASARDWPARHRLMEAVRQDAAHARRTLIILPTADAAAGIHSGPLEQDAWSARTSLTRLLPQPRAADARGALARLDIFRAAIDSHALWLSDGLENPGNAALARRLLELGSLTVWQDAPSQPALLLRPPERTEDGLRLTLLRAPATAALRVPVQLEAEDGAILAASTAEFAPGDAAARLILQAPEADINQAARIVATPRTAGSIYLLDSAWQRKQVGLVGKEGAEAQPFIGGRFYLEKALQDSAELQPGSVPRLLHAGIDVIIIEEGVGLTAENRAALKTWVRGGGLLIRFADPALAAQEDDLLPVSLTGRERALGGALSWEKPLRLGAFTAGTPLAGLEPDAEVRVMRQYLSSGAPENIWLTAHDGTPLISGKRMGRGSSVLFHVGSTPAASNLPLSGLWVAILKRLLPLAGGGASGAAQPSLPAWRLLNARGQLESPAAPVPLLDTALLESPGPQQDAGAAPAPGYYGSADARTAVNLGRFLPVPQAMTAWPRAAERITSAPESNDSAPRGLQAPLLLAALLLLLLDMMISLRWRGVRLHLPARPVAALLVLFLLPQPAGAQPASPGPVLDVLPGAEAARLTTLAYVRTDNPGDDGVSRAGLLGLARALQSRTAIEDVARTGVMPGRDDLSIYPLLFWSLRTPESLQGLPENFLTALNDYMRTGGLLVLDVAGDLTPQELQSRLRQLDLPPLRPLPADHVLARSFYLLPEFPGREAGAPVWIPRTDAQSADGVPGLIVTRNDWIGAWAEDAGGRPVFLPAPGGLAQREQALRVGVNLVMLALTGSYKSDQVHVGAILERLAP